MTRYCWLAAWLLLCLAGCAKQDQDAPAANDSGRDKPTTARALAYERFLTLDVDNDRVAPIYQLAESLCEQASAAQCAILGSQLDAGEAATATLKLRATASGIREISDRLAKEGRIAKQSVTGVDLATPIGDSAKRLDILREDRTRLEALTKQTDAELSGLMQLNNELAQVQGQIEALTGERAHLEQRVATEILNIEIVASNAISAWAPLGEALRAFNHNFAAATSALVTALAFLLPWSIFVGVCAWLVNVVMRRVGLRVSHVLADQSRTEST